MDISEAVKVLEEYIAIDRDIRDNDNNSDYDKFCENQCLAIETILKFVESNKLNGGV